MKITQAKVVDKLYTNNKKKVKLALHLKYEKKEYEVNALVAMNEESEEITRVSFEIDPVIFQEHSNLSPKELSEYIRSYLYKYEQK